jgi:very-short-patch-repair endonuclease
MAAVLSCGPVAALSHHSAGGLLGICVEHDAVIHVSVVASSARRRPGIRVHRRPSLGPVDLARHAGIPVTRPVRTLLDLATVLGPRPLEAAVNAAANLDLIDPESLRAALDSRAGQPGVVPLRRLLDRHTSRLTDSELERLFLRLVRRSGLPPPVTRQRLNEFRVDFVWPAFGLVVEADSLRYHRTPGQQKRDRERDQAHTAVGLTPLRFTHAQVRYEPKHVEATLIAVARRLGRPQHGPPGASIADRAPGSVARRRLGRRASA